MMNKKLANFKSWEKVSKNLNEISSKILHFKTDEELNQGLYTKAELKKLDSCLKVVDRFISDSEEKMLKYIPDAPFIFYHSHESEHENMKLKDLMKIIGERSFISINDADEGASVYSGYKKDISDSVLGRYSECGVVHVYSGDFQLNISITNR